MPAPTSPPISACELDDGMPKYQVIRFQLIAPISAPKITRGSTIAASTMPRPTVSATCRPKNRNAMKLKKAAQATAYCGRSTRVETMVAMELAASCRPLRKSNASATSDQRHQQRECEPDIHRVRASPDLHVLDDDAVHHVGDVVEAVDHLLQMIVDLVADEEGQSRFRPMRWPDRARAGPDRASRRRGPRAPKSAR